MAKLNIKKLATSAVNRGLGAGIGGGANPMLDKVFPETVTSTVKTAIKVGVGAVAPEFVPKMKIADSVGAGLIGAAVSDFVREKMDNAGTSGVGNIDRGYIIDEDRVQGPGEVSPISGDEDYDEVVIEGEDPEDVLS